MVTDSMVKQMANNDDASKTNKLDAQASVAAQVPTTTSILQNLLKIGRIRPLDLAFAEFVMLHEHGKHAVDVNGIHVVGLLAAYLSSRLGEQDSCLNLDNTYQPFLPFYRFEPIDQLLPMLSASTCVAVVDERYTGEVANASTDKSTEKNALKSRASTSCEPVFAPQSKPLILQGSELYMQRYWQYEVQLASKINSMTGRATTLDVAQGQALLAQLFATLSLIHI